MLDIIFIVGSVLAIVYWIIEYPYLNERAGAENSQDFIISVIGVLISLEVARRVLGWSLALIGIFFLLYAYFGPYMPDVIQHGGFSIKEIAIGMFISINGVFGIMANVLATYVILFIFFGAFLKKSGATQFFIDFALSVAGDRKSTRLNSSHTDISRMPSSA